MHKNESCMECFTQKNVLEESVGRGRTACWMASQGESGKVAAHWTNKKRNSIQVFPQWITNAYYNPVV